MVRILNTLGLIVIMLVAGILLALNAEPVNLNYYLGSYQLPLFLALMLAMGLGALLGLLGSVGVIVRQKREIGSLKKSLKTAEQELALLRTQPFKDTP